MAPNYTLRSSKPQEFARLSTIENQAGELYAEAGIPADLQGLPIAAFARAHCHGLLSVLADNTDLAVAFALCWRRPDTLHLRELNVHPEHMRRRLGRRLIEHVRARAHAEALSQVTLTTFSEVLWNAPLYRRYGFAELRPESCPFWLKEIRAQETAQGLDRWPRVVMAIPSSPEHYIT